MSDQLTLAQKTSALQLTDNFTLQDFQIIHIPKSPIINVNSYSMSKDKQKLLICTQTGVIILEQILCQQQKRLVIFDYLNDNTVKSQKLYLDRYYAKQPNTKLRYLETLCQNYNQEDYNSNIKDKNNNINNNSINNKKQQPTCNCGRFLISQCVPRIIVYIKSNPTDINNSSSLYIFRQQYGIQQYFTSINTKPPFQFCLSSQGQYLAYTLNNGTNINVYNIKEKKLYCVLYAGMASRQILKMNFFRATIQGKITLCIGMIRKRQQSLGTMHVFKIQMKTPTVAIESQYKRTINLFERTLKDYQIAQKLIGPDFYVHQNILYVFSMCGIVQEAISFQKGYIKDKKNIQDIYARWEEEDYNTLNQDNQ